VKNFLSKIFKRKVEYHPPVVMRTHVVPNTTQHLYKNCKNILSENQIPLKKIKFVYEKSFIYDVDNNKINPEYKTIIPIKKNHPVIEVDKPENTMEVFLGEYRTVDNYATLKQLTGKTKKGIAFLVHADIENVMWLSNLDDAVNHYWNSWEDFEYNT